MNIKKAVSISVMACSMTVVAMLCNPVSTENPPVSVRLAEGEKFRILSPNGGEVLKYGDTLTITWLQNSDTCDEAGIYLTSDGGFSYCLTTETEDEFLNWPRDRDAKGVKSYTYIDAHTVQGTFKVAMTDVEKPLNGCTLKFEGSSMMIKVYDPYAPSQCNNCKDLSDAVFTINK